MEAEVGSYRKSDPETSRDAANSINVTPLQSTVVNELAKVAPGGLTTFELASITGIHLVTISPRLDLSTAGSCSGYRHTSEEPSNYQEFHCLGSGAER